VQTGLINFVKIHAGKNTDHGLAIHLSGDFTQGAGRCQEYNYLSFVFLLQSEMQLITIVFLQNPAT
jgi:hypothetical protein